MPRKKRTNHTFTEAVLYVVRSIPKGKTLSYSQVAKAAGSPRAARAVGSIMAKNYRPDIPCHRVIKADGTPGHYNRGGARAKSTRLKEEGVDL